MSKVDILLVADARFSGGSATALLADAAGFLQMGATIGLLPVTSSFLNDDEDPPNQAVLGLGDHPQVTLLGTDQPVAADIAFLHHPMTFAHGIAERVPVRARRAVLVAHHPAFRGDGSLEYNPLATNRSIHRTLGLRPVWAPVSGLIRRQLRSFAPLLRLSDEDWINVFDTGRWQSTRPAFSSDAPAVAGRHGRADALKWGARPDTLGLPACSGDWAVRVMGCPKADLVEMGADISGWDILDFDAEPVDRFLDSLDVFSFFHHPRWVEAFGRTIVEAMLMERPCLLDPALEPTFGDLARYCPAEEAPAALETLRGSPHETRALATRTRQEVVRRYADATIPERLDRLRRDPGTISRRGPRSASIPTTLRKALGLARRGMV